MTAIALSEFALRATKRALADAYPDARSAHLTEALASACGFGSQAALLAHVREQDPHDPPIVLLDDRAFIERIGRIDPSLSDLADDPIRFDWLSFPDHPDIIRTQALRGEEIPYATTRDRAWRNAMVAAVNAGVEQRLFTVRPGDDRWKAASKTRAHGAVYRFEIDGIPGLAHVDDAGFDELTIHVALWPGPEAEQWIGAANAGFRTGDLFASGWLERRDGAWLQFNGHPVLSCRRHRLQTAAALKVRPSGFAETGPFKM